MKAEELIEKESAGIYNTNEPIIPKSKALEAVILARKEEKERALQALQTVLAEWMPSSAKVVLDDFKAELAAKQ